MSNRSRPFFRGDGCGGSSKCALALTARIYKNDAGQAASGAAFSGNEWSIPRFRADFLCFTSKIVAHSRYLPTDPDNPALTVLRNRKHQLSIQPLKPKKQENLFSWKQVIMAILLTVPVSRGTIAALYRLFVLAAIAILTFVPNLEIVASTQYFRKYPTIGFWKVACL